jgi:hypothetical protein
MPKTEDTPPDAAAEETAPPAPEVETAPAPEAEAPPAAEEAPPAPEVETAPAPEAEAPPAAEEIVPDETDETDAPDLRTAIAIFIEGGQQFVAAAAGLQAYIDHLNAQLAATGPDAEPYVYTPPRGDG